jgi:hypothetical protein
MTKSFLNKLNLKPYLDSICSGKIGYSSIQNRIVRFYDFSLLLDFLLSWSLDAFYPFSMLQNILDLQILKCSSCHVLVLKLQKLDNLEWETGWSDFF